MGGRASGCMRKRGENLGGGIKQELSRSSRISWCSRWRRGAGCDLTIGIFFVVCFFFLSSFVLRVVGSASATTAHRAKKNVVLRSLTIFRTHELLSSPSVYFQCKGESRHSLPDVRHANKEYSWEGHESFQPVTVLEDDKCKRCGFYEAHWWKSDIFGEWELCPLHFLPPSEGGFNVQFRAGEFNATFVCVKCNGTASTSQGFSSSSSSSSVAGSGVDATSVNSSDADAAAADDDDNDEESKKTNPEGIPSKKSSKMEGSSLTVTVLIVVVMIAVGVIMGVLGYMGYLKWQERRREAQMRRFEQLFNDEDDLEDQLRL